jgi:multidrug efflux system membrane fusion protein
VFHARASRASAQTSAESGATGRGAGAGTGQRAVPVQLAAARRGDINVYLSGLIGTVTALNTVTVHTRVDGELVNVAFHEGQMVHSGDLLAEIDPRPFEVQLEQAEGQLNRDQAQLKNAQLDLERYRVLLSEDSVPKQQYDTQQATVTQDEGVIKSDQAQIDTAKLNLTYARVTAPLTGRIGLRLVDPGNIVHAADQNGLVVITQVQPIGVIFPIPEDALPRVLPKVHAGQHLAVDAFDRDPVKPTLLGTGEVLTLDNQVDVATGTVKVKAVFQNQDDRLFPNQFVNARLLVDTLKAVVIVPSAAVQRGPQATYVFVIKPDSTVDMRTVDVQLTQGDDTVIKNGVAEGEVVVTDGLDKLQPGTHVQWRPTPTPTPTTAPAAPAKPSRGR